MQSCMCLGTGDLSARQIFIAKSSYVKQIEKHWKLTELCKNAGMCSSDFCLSFVGCKLTYFAALQKEKKKLALGLK